MYYYNLSQFMRQQQARLDEERTQPAIVSIEVYPMPTGKIYGHNQNPGPLDGKPENNWYCKAIYEDGKEQTWGPAK